jgi:Mlc titration factor MtfA (ptsG expression regulator)
MFHRRKGLPADWYDIVTSSVAMWTALDGNEQEQLQEICDWLLRHKHWEASNGFALDDTILVTVAMNAALLVLGLDVEEYREVSAIIVYPSAVLSPGQRRGPASGTVSEGPLPILGEAHDRRGPVILAWDDAQRSARNPGSGHNVVFHEFAHKLDMFDGIVDGTPLLENRAEVARWVAACTEAFQALRAGVERPPLDPYGATNPAEFFAVATEAFFDVPVALEEHEPALFEVLRDFYKQDPAERARRSVRSREP